MFKLLPVKKNDQTGIVMPAILLLVAVVVILAYLLLSSTLPFKDTFLSALFPKQASNAAGVVDLSLIPNAVNIKQNDTFLVDITIDAKTEQPTAMDLEINYDPQYLQATALEPGFFFTKTLVAPALSSGKATVTLAQDINGYKTGTGTVATLAFKALQNTASPSMITINPTNTQIAAIGQSVNVVGNISNSTVTVSQLAAITKNSQMALSAPAASPTVGAEFAVQVKVKTATDSANLFVSKMSFDPAKLAVSRIDTAGSFITQWVNDNSFDNTNGKISLIGGVPTPGYQSNSLVPMATVYFTGKTAGSSLINLDAASSIYRNSDNQNILGSLTDATVTLSGAAVSPSPSISPSPSPAVSPSPIVSPSPAVSPLPSAAVSPSPSAAASVNPSPSVIASASVAPSPLPSPSGSVACAISQASWDASSNPIISGKVVSLKVQGTGNCDGKSLSFTVLEDDGVLGTDPTKNTPPSVKFNSNSATTSWLAEFQTDGFNGFNNPPEYFFNVTLDGTTQVKSNAPLLSVTEAAPGQYIKGDANRDGKVDYTDLSIMLSNFNKTSGYNDELDYNDDGIINVPDYSGIVQLLFLAGLVS